MPLGVASKGDEIAFGEYNSTTLGQPIHIYHSTDGGQTWNITNTQTDIHHFHSVQYLARIDRWLATTGDGNIRWLISKSNTANNWVTMVDSKDQRLRTLAVLGFGRDKLIWSGDGTIGFEGVFSASLIGRQVWGQDVSRLFLLPNTSYAIGGEQPVIIAGTTVIPSSVAEVNKTPAIFVSLDEGRTWCLDRLFQMSSSGAERGVFAVLGPDSKGNYYTWMKNIADQPQQFTTRMTLNTEVRPKLATKPEPVHTKKLTQTRFAEHIGTLSANTTKTLVEVGNKPCTIHSIDIRMDRDDSRLRFLLSFWEFGGVGWRPYKIIRTPVTTSTDRIYPAMLADGDSLLTLEVIDANNQRIYLANKNIEVAGFKIELVNASDTTDYSLAASVLCSEL